MPQFKKMLKNTWTFGALVLVPLFRFLWRMLVKNTQKQGSSSSSPRVGDVYKKGDVIDVQVKK